MPRLIFINDTTGNERLFVSTIPLRFQYSPPDEEEIRGQIDYMKETGNQAPRRRPGDRYPIAGALVGIIIGIIIAFTTGLPWVVIAGPIGGGIAGALLGSLVGTLITKYLRSRDNPRYS